MIKPKYYSCILFIAGFIALAYLLNAVLLRGLRRISTGQVSFINEIASGKLNAEVLIQGSSRTRFHFDSRLLGEKIKKRCFNIGMPSCSLEVQWPVQKIYFSHNQKPKILIVGLDMTMFEADFRVVDPERFIARLDEESLYQSLRKIDPEFWIYRNVPLYLFSRFGIDVTVSALKALIKKERWATGSLTGYTPIHKSWDSSFENWVQEHPEGRDLVIEPRLIENLRAMIKLCRQNGTQFVMVYSPAHVDSYPYFKNYKEIFELFRKISKEEGVEYFDFSKSAIARHRNYFYNSQHLNYEGSQKFTRLFATALKRRLPAGRQAQVNERATK